LLLFCFFILIVVCYRRECIILLLLLIKTLKEVYSFLFVKSLGLVLLIITLRVILLFTFILLRFFYWLLFLLIRFTRETKIPVKFRRLSCLLIRWLSVSSTLIGLFGIFLVPLVLGQGLGCLLHDDYRFITKEVNSRNRCRLDGLFLPKIHSLLLIVEKFIYRHYFRLVGVYIDCNIWHI
jgi:hypothetical protein